MKLILWTLLFVMACATDQLEVKPDLDPGNSVGVDIKSCFSQAALDSKWGLGVPQIWNMLNGCKETNDGKEEEQTEEEADQEGVLAT